MQLPPRLESLVLKSGLHLGLLSESDRALVLALAVRESKCGTRATVNVELRGQEYPSAGASL